ncbi:glycosyltransferase family 9 protein [Bacteroidota bacterium]
MDKPLYFSDCKFFRGDIPCRQHKEEGVHCESCKYYEPKKGIILIIKLGAVGDVIRTTPLLYKISSEYPESLVWWLTYTPEILPDSIDKILPYTPESIVALLATHFNIIINLDKDTQACSLAGLISSDKKAGFILKDGKPAPVDENAQHKFITGIFDDVNRENKKSYLEEIFEICGWKFNGEEYILNCDNSINWDIPNDNKKIVGLNTGCGGRWISRLWDDKNWEELIRQLQDNGMFPVLLGGAQEDEKNRKLSGITGAYYPGHFSFQEFISLVNQCNVVVSAVTMAMHIAIGLKKPLILMNNIFNKNEFELYGRGEIIEPEKPCQCYFSPKCKNSDYFCMDYLSPKRVFEAVKNTQ